MERFMLSFLTTTVIMALVIFVVLIFRFIMPEKFSPKLRYMMWVVILVGLAIPIRPFFGDGLVTFHLSPTPPVGESTVFYGGESATAPPPVSEPATYGEVILLPTPQIRSVSLYEILTAVWLFVAAAILSYHIWKYISFLKLAKRWSVAVTETSILSLFQHIKHEKGLARKNIALKKCGFVSTSMLVGFFRPVVLLPEKEFDADELELIFRHELIHYKRKDLFVKLLSMFAVSLNWFNPAVYLMNNAMQADCEASCDEAVLLDAGEQNKQLYAELIIDMVSGKKNKGTLLSTCFYGGKKSIEARMAAILNSSGRAKKLALSIPLMLLVLTVLSGSVFAFNESVYYPRETDDYTPIYAEYIYEAEASISAVAARDIALAETGGGIFEGLYYDDYLGVFRIEILQGDTRLYLAVDSESGEVMIYRRSAR